MVSAGVARPEGHDMSYGYIADTFELREGAFDTYRQQQVTFALDSGRWRLEPAKQVGGAFPFDDTVYLLSAWHPNGFPASWGQNMRYTAELVARVTEANGSAIDGVSHAANRTWFEGALLVSGLRRRAVLDLAAEFGAPAYVEWTPDELRVIPISEQIERSTMAWSLTSVERLCALNPDAQVGERCVRRGGEWIGASIEAAAASALEHAHAYALLGCDTCQGKQQHNSRGGPIGLSEVSPASRWCGLTSLGWTPSTIVAANDGWDA